MPIVAIHSVRTAKGLPLEPVGVWAIDGDHFTPHYPSANEHFIGRAKKALFFRPGGVRLEDWAFHKAQSSPNWRIHEKDAFLFDETVDPLVVFSNAQKDHSATVTTMKEWAVHERLLAAE
ncbi:hypothetical protein [Cryobacterium arcticum]|uniref:Uncharacterized protein n=1 Tax=Cryobacterium arcticum TaxID=670052 RepID=A0A317ZPV4_9MICO|nr:hypothetical protein [Cryobacterium arcticum]PXA67073.1 hypothetical protein CTB96_09875 [Cryobacterium arcticum]